MLTCLTVALVTRAEILLAAHLARGEQVVSEFLCNSSTV